MLHFLNMYNFIFVYSYNKENCFPVYCVLSCGHIKSIVLRFYCICLLCDNDFKSWSYHIGSQVCAVQLVYIITITIQWSACKQVRMVSVFLWHAPSLSSSSYILLLPLAPYFTFHTSFIFYLCPIWFCFLLLITFHNIAYLLSPSLSSTFSFCTLSVNLIILSSFNHVHISNVCTSQYIEGNVTSIVPLTLLISPPRHSDYLFCRKSYIF